jgi:hypothetical protein
MQYLIYGRKGTETMHTQRDCIVEASKIMVKYSDAGYDMSLFQNIGSFAAKPKHGQKGAKS